MDKNKTKGAKNTYKKIINKNTQKKKEELNNIQTIQNNKIKNSSNKGFETLNKKDKLDNNIFSEDKYSTKHYKKNNFSDIKLKQKKSNFDSILSFINKKQIQKYNCKLNDIKTKNKKNINNVHNYTIINNKKKILKKIPKINEKEEEYFKTFIINKYSTTFAKKPFVSFDENKNMTEVLFNQRKKKKNFFTKSFEDKKFIRFKIFDDLYHKEISKPKIKYNSSLVSKRNKKENSKKLIKLKNNQYSYKLTEYSSSFNNSLPSSVNKIKFNYKKNQNQFEKNKSHKIFITNININLYKENENNYFTKNNDNRNININHGEEKNIDLEKVYLLEEKSLKILKKINNYNSCDEECFNWISFYFRANFYTEEFNLFKKINNYKKIFTYAKMEVICYFLFYDISLNQDFNSASILLKAIMNILHENFLVLMVYFLHIYNNNKKDNNKDNNNIWINKIEKIIDTELKIKLNSEDINEDFIINMIYNTINNINNYYKIIIDNLYNYEDIHQEENIFPDCLKLKDNKNISLEKRKKLICLFFTQVKNDLNEYTFDNMKLFFDLYLNNDNIQFNESKMIKYYIPPIKPKYKYTILINMDETLIYYNKNINKIILRPNLFNFLSKIKQMYELIAFSFYNNSIINQALDLIENESKYFDYILYQEQLDILKNLETLDRSIKHLIVIDTKNNINKKYKKNLILIKGFYGDINCDINLLKILGYILENIKNSINEDDIRIRINKYKNTIKTYLCNN